jgi:hypothetical protein
MVFRQNTNYPKEVIMTHKYEVTVTEITFTGEAENEQDALKQTLDFLNESEFVSTFGSVKVLPVPFTLIDTSIGGSK